jgi:hypothetical protein
MQVDKAATKITSIGIPMNTPNGAAQTNVENVKALLKRLKNRPQAETVSEANDILNVYMQGSAYQGGDLRIGNVPDSHAFIERYKFELSNPTGFVAARDAIVWGIKRVEANLDSGDAGDALITYQALRSGSAAVMYVRDNREKIGNSRSGPQPYDPGYYGRDLPPRILHAA